MDWAAFAALADDRAELGCALAALGVNLTERDLELVAENIALLVRHGRVVTDESARDEGHLQA